jgi:hypothetical protein
MDILVGNISSKESFGDCSLESFLNISSLPRQELLGSFLLDVALRTLGVSGLEYFPSPILIISIPISGIESEETLGQTAVNSISSISGIESNETLGQTIFNSISSVSGIESEETLGQTTFNSIISISGIESEEILDNGVLMNNIAFEQDLIWRINKKRFGMLGNVPGTIFVLIAATLTTSIFSLPIETIGSRFGGIPSSLPSPQWLGISWESAQFLIAPAMTLALLSAIESLLCARIADGLTHSRHQPNQELMGQGIANFCVPFLGGMPVTGTIARTVTNIESGARTPISAIVHSLTLLLIIILAAPLAKDIPLACLAAILIYIAWNMGEWNKFIDFKQFRMPYRITMISVFLLTVMVDLTVAVEVGLLLAFLTFIYRISSLSRIERTQAQDYPFLEDLTGKVMGYRIYGALFFGAVQLLEEIENNLGCQSDMKEFSKFDKITKIIYKKQKEEQNNLNNSFANLSSQI